MDVFTDPDGTNTSVEVFNVGEDLFAELPAVLHCLRGDLGRWKGGARVWLDFTRLPEANLTELTTWLRAHELSFQVEVTTRITWRADPRWGPRALASSPREHAPEN